VTLATSRNLTVLGVSTILVALGTAAIALFDGDPQTVVNWGATIAACITGVGLILGKGAASTGGTVDGKGNPV
jgi:hypothetical protein